MQNYIDAVDKLLAALAAMPEHHRLSLAEGDIPNLIDAVRAARPPEATGHEREAVVEAHDLWGTDDIEIDDTAYVSHADDGYWVSAWLWVPQPEEDEDADLTTTP